MILKNHTKPPISQRLQTRQTPKLNYPYPKNNPQPSRIHTSQPVCPDFSILPLARNIKRTIITPYNLIVRLANTMDPGYYAMRITHALQ